MRIAVLSGKGGTGKTFVATNLAVSHPGSVYIDCDVEEPNGRIFLKTDHLERSEVCVPLPAFDVDKCTACRDCVAFCKFNALAFVGQKPRLFKEVCHHCGGCSLVCRYGAASEVMTSVGIIEQGTRGDVGVITGELNIGEASGVPVIRSLLKLADDTNSWLTVIDCPPGSSCQVTESISDADFCLIVAEPGAFGFHNFAMVSELCRLMCKPMGVVINKWTSEYRPLEDYCRELNIPVLARIPLDMDIARTISEGGLVSERMPEVKEMFEKLLLRIGGML